MQMVKIYDTTLRDGVQAEDISFSIDDKIRIAEKIDELGIHYIEGGWPGSNPKDVDFFNRIRGVDLKNARIVAFGSTHKSTFSPDNDPNLKALIDSRVEAVTIVGKSWDIHVSEVLGITYERNLEIIHDTIKYLNSYFSEVFYDAEHLFDGFKANPSYTMDTLKSAVSGGAHRIFLCDTNGGTMPHELEMIIREIQKEISLPLGIHTHNDAEMAVANSIIAVRQGIDCVQGTINGYGERCGNANLCSIIPDLQLKMQIECIPDEGVKKLREISRFVDEMANLPPKKHRPYVGDAAFTHKAGLHVQAVRKNSKTYEHIEPQLVGNRRRILVSDQAGVANILYKAEEFGLKLSAKDQKTREILKRIKDLENQGFQFEGAEASFELLMRKALGKYKKFFTLMGFRVINERRQDDKVPFSEATIMIKVDDKVEHTAAVGDGPVNALDNAIRKALEKFYPQLREVKLIDYKVRVLPAGKGTSSAVRVLIESGDKEERWDTVGVSENIIQASWQALVDSLEYKLEKTVKKISQKSG